MAKEAMMENSPRLVSFDLNENDSICGGNISVFIEPVAPSEKVYIFGAGHIALYLSKMAVMTGFKVIIIDDREEYANRERFPEVHNIIVSDFKSAFEKLEIEDNSYIVIVTKGHVFDEVVLECACGTNARYIGMIGSKTKIQHLFSNLRQNGVDDKKLAGVHAPIGLDIGSQTPSEIAVSILAEMIQVRYNREK
jgi:xanthine dehydrogenase accessory factor